MNCRKCGTELPAGAMFCAECGATVAAPKLVEPQTRTRPGDTAIIPPLDLRVAPPAFLEPDFGRAAVEPAVSRPSFGERERPVAPRGETPPTPPRVRTPVVPEVPEVPEPPLVAEPPVVAEVPVVAELPPTPPVVEVPVAPPAAPPVAPASRLPRPAPVSPAPLAVPVADLLPESDPFPESDYDDLEATRIVSNRQGDRFVLQFSTGENATVFGTGLIGRNPVVQPGENFDQIVAIVDSGKSVSKTHLEFGQTAGAFWVADRFSANGTVVRQPDARPQRLDPGKRQIVARGTRVDIGEQFFVVS